MSSQTDRVLGSANVALTNASTNWAANGAPSIVVDGQERKLTARASAAASKTDTVTKVAAPAVKPDEGFAVLYTAGLTGTNDAVEYGESFSKTGGGGKFPSVPVHMKEGQVPIGFALFRNDGDADWTYGTSNFNASGLKKVVRDLAELPSYSPWEDVA